MDSIIVKAYPKVNLMLHVIGKHKNKHKLQSLFYFFSSGFLYDSLAFDHKKSFSTISARIKNVPSENNIIHKAVTLLKESFELFFIPHVDIQKRIPIGSGLGGGSADAAKFCHYIMQSNNVPTKQQKDFIPKSNKLGSDVPVFLEHYLRNKSLLFFDENCDPMHRELNSPYSDAKSSISTEQQKILENLAVEPTQQKSTYREPNKKSSIITINSRNKPLFLLGITNVGFCSTSKVFSVYNNEFSKCTSIPENITAFLQNSKNDLLDSAMKICPEIKNVLLDLEYTNPIIARMSGSGSSCFGLYSSKEECIKAEAALAKKYDNDALFNAEIS
jgi:4-diphosphocytidyl-2-C-methyl-D-erythritol kinase